MAFPGNPWMPPKDPWWAPDLIWGKHVCCQCNVTANTWRKLCFHAAVAALAASSQRSLLIRQRHWRLRSTPPPPLSLPVSALLACIRCVAQAASQQQTFGEDKPGLRSHTAPSRFAWTHRGGSRTVILISAALCAVSEDHFFPLTPPLSPLLPRLCGWLTADLMVLSRLVWLKACGQGASVGPQREKPLSTGATVLCPVIVNGLRSIRDFLQSLWVICGRRWRTGLRCFPYPLSIPSLPPAAGKSLQAEWWWREDGGGCARFHEWTIWHWG